MSGSSIGDVSWNQMTEAEKTEVVRNGRATMRQLAQGLLDGPEELREACRYSLVHTGSALAELPSQQAEGAESNWGGTETHLTSPTKTAASIKRRRIGFERAKQRFGLPASFVPRQNHQGRTALLLENIYSLPNGKEFIPQDPTGTLGKSGHLYALVTLVQYQHGKRGSVYIRSDGRIFDYSVADDRSCELYDTGYTIHDLERTGRYASPPKDMKIQRPRKGMPAT